MSNEEAESRQVAGAKRILAFKFLVSPLLPSLCNAHVLAIATSNAFTIQVFY